MRSLLGRVPNPRRQPGPGPENRAASRTRGGPQSPQSPAGEATLQPSPRHGSVHVVVYVTKLRRRSPAPAPPLLPCRPRQAHSSTSNLKATRTHCQNNKCLLLIACLLIMLNCNEAALNDLGFRTPELLGYWRPNSLFKHVRMRMRPMNDRL